jgi:hypothetical protein
MPLLQHSRQLLLLLALAALAHLPVSEAVSVGGEPLPSWFAIVAAGVGIGIGIMEAFFGYKLFRVTLFLLGFTVSGVAVFIGAYQNIDNSAVLWIALGMGVPAGLLGGGLSYYLYKVGVFVVGSSLGVIGGLVLNMTIFKNFGLASPYPMVLLIAPTIILGIITGVIGLKVMRATMIASTSVVGAYSTVKGIEYYAMGDSFVNDFQVNSDLSASVSDTTYYVAGGTAALAAIGMFVQFKYTGKKKEGREDEKDEWEREFDESEVSLDALKGE